LATILRGRISLQLKISASYIALLVTVLVLMNTYPLLVSEDLVFRSKCSSLLSSADAVELVKETFAQGADYDGEMPGKSAVECGNYINLDVELAKRQCAVYSEIVREWTAEKLAY